VRDDLKALRKYMDRDLSAATDRYTAQLETVLHLAARGLRVPRGFHQDLRDKLSEVDRLIIGCLAQYWESGEWGVPHCPLGAYPWPDDKPGNLAEGLIAFQFISYIRYTLRQMRNLIYFVMVGFVLSIVALHSYPFQEPRVITTFITIMFGLFALGIVLVMVQADRDPILSRITNTRPGALNAGFFKRLGLYLAVPAVTVLASQVPSWGRFLFSWVQPALEALK
jgi:hypothetical protein